MVNYVAVIVAGVLSMAIGAFWYSPAGFGKQWMKLMGFTKKDLNEAKEKGMGKSYALAFLSTLVMSYVLAVFVGFANAATILNGAVVGFWLWLGFIATTMLGIVLLQNKPVKLYVLNIAHYLVVMLVTGAILAVWV
jgi:hypothetical protein